MSKNNQRLNIKQRNITSKDHRASRIYSSRIKRLKVFFVSIACCFLLTLLLWPQMEELIHDKAQGETQSPPELTKDSIEVANTLYNPHMCSTDSNGRPYKITANTAKAGNDRSAVLENPESTFEDEEGTQYVIQAKTGHVDETQKHIVYETDVTLDTNTGYHIETQKAELDVEQKITQGNCPIKGEGPTGTMHAAEGFEIDHDHAILRLKGKTRLIFYQ